MHEVEVKGILSAKNGMNLYRGCSHGCIYCDARSECYQMKHAFEDIEIKINAPELLEKALRSKRKKCMIGTGAMSDPYLHIEEEYGITRKCLEIINHYGFGLAIQTKSARILRDLDLLKEINQKCKCVVQMTLTTYDEQLCKKLEPNVSTTRERLEVLKVMKENGIPTIVWLSPVLPFINDTLENIAGIMQGCIEAGVHGILCFHMGVTLRDGDREYFYKNLDCHFPGIKQKYIEKYGNRYELVSDNDALLMKYIRSKCRENHMLCGAEACFTYLNTYEEKKKFEQLSLYDL